MSRKNPILFIFFISVAGLFFFHASCRGDSNKLGEYRTAVARKGDMEITVSAPGRVEPEAAIEIKSKASGQILELPFQEGDRVKKGDLLVRLDPETEQRLLGQAQAQRETASASLVKAEILYESAAADLKRLEGLKKSQVVPVADLEEAGRKVKIQNQEIKICRANLASAEEELKNATARLEDTEIRAPRDAIIIDRMVEPGQIISSGISSLTAGTTLMVMADLSSILVRSEVNEADISRVKPGQNVRIELDAFPDAVFEGKVIRISPQGHSSSGITVFDTIIEVTDSRRSHLRPMMSARVEIITDEVKDALLVPVEALRRDKGEIGLWVMKGKNPVWRKVEIGVAGWDELVILEGLSPGETIILGPGP
jgi:HlyD family secretion protein